MSDNHTDPHHVLPFSLYIYVYSALLVLTVLTVFVAQFHFGVFNGLVAMGIATVKASLVAMYFMHLKWDSKLYLVILLGSVGFLFVLAGFSLFDFVTRVPIESGL